MPRIKQTDEQKLISLKARLEKAKVLRDRYNREISAVSNEIKLLEEKARLKTMETIVSDPEKLKAIFDLGIISQDEFNALSPSNAKAKSEEAQQTE